MWVESGWGLPLPSAYAIIISMKAFFKRWALDFISKMFWLGVILIACTIFLTVFLLFGWLGAIIVGGILMFGIGGALEAFFTGALMGVGVSLVSKKMGGRF